MLEEKDMTLTFFPHYQTQKLGAETPVFHERIKVLKQGEETVQSLLKRHRLLITDYSTVSFDFAYMNKPVIFFSLITVNFILNTIMKARLIIGQSCLEQE